jgi:hypothetical protein
LKRESEMVLRYFTEELQFSWKWNIYLYILCFNSNYHKRNSEKGFKCIQPVHTKLLLNNKKQIWTTILGHHGRIL